MKPRLLCLSLSLCVAFASHNTASARGLFKGFKVNIGHIITGPVSAALEVSVSTNQLMVYAVKGDNIVSLAREHDTFGDLVTAADPGKTRLGVIEAGQKILIRKIVAHLNGWQTFTNVEQVVDGCALYTYVLSGLSISDDMTSTKSRYAKFVAAIKQKSIAIDKISTNILDEVNLFCIPSLNTDYGFEPVTATNEIPAFDFSSARKISTALLPTVPVNFREKIGQGEGPFLLTVGKPLAGDQNGKIEVSRPLLLADLSGFSEVVFRQMVVDYQTGLRAGVKSDRVEVFESFRAKLANFLVMSGKGAKELLGEVSTIVKSAKDEK